MLILIPCKTLDHGKSRLASHFDARSRRSLCEFFLCHTLSLATSVAPASDVRIISADAGAVQIGADYGVRALADNGVGLNQSLIDARAELLLSGADHDDVLILPIDLPLATPAAVERVMKTPADVVVVPDRAMTGTNMLLLRRRAFRTFPFQFGPDSFGRHCATARSAGHCVAVVGDEAQLQLDVDRPPDYAEWIETAIRETGFGKSLVPPTLPFSEQRRAVQSN